MISLICASTNGSANKGDAGDLRCHHAHYDVIVMVASIVLNAATMQSCIGHMWLAPFWHCYMFTRSHKHDETGSELDRNRTNASKIRPGLAAFRYIVGYLKWIYCNGPVLPNCGKFSGYSMYMITWKRPRKFISIDYTLIINASNSQN